jgi:E3 ubiquitin-protein ligase SHPRH
MVHSTNSRCAEMANRLAAVNRWCVTGTPIGRSLGDLHGLFTFIREDPYMDKKWFKYCLFETFQSGDKMSMAKAVSNVLWRTSKRFVEDQINIPKQTEICYWLDFSPFEAHLYQRVLEIFRDNRKTAFKNIDAAHAQQQIAIQDVNNNITEEHENVENFFSKYLRGNCRLDEIERSVIDQLLAPLIDMRLACNHPQLVLRKRTFMAQNTLAKKKEK